MGVFFKKYTIYFYTSVQKGTPFCTFFAHIFHLFELGNPAIYCPSTIYLFWHIVGIY